MGQPKLVFWDVMWPTSQNKKFRAQIYLGNAGLNKLHWFLQAREGARSLSQTFPCFLGPPVTSPLTSDSPEAGDVSAEEKNTCRADGTSGSSPTSARLPEGGWPVSSPPASVSPSVKCVCLPCDEAQTSKSRELARFPPPFRHPRLVPATASQEAGGGQGRGLGMLTGESRGHSLGGGGEGETRGAGGGEDGGREGRGRGRARGSGGETRDSWEGRRLRKVAGAFREALRLSDEGGGQVVLGLEFLRARGREGWG